jgi:hypothetical protein
MVNEPDKKDGESLRQAFVRQFCNNGGTRWLRGIFWDEKEKLETVLKWLDYADFLLFKTSKRYNARVKEYKDEGAMFILKVENGETYEASMPIPKWNKVGKLKLRK